MDDKNAKGRVYRDARTRAGMTQEHLAGASRLSPRTIRRAEAGENIGFEAKRAIGAVLGLDPSAVLSEAPVVHRILHRREIVLRMVALKLFSWTGGIHPILLLCFLALLYYMAVDFKTPWILFPTALLTTYGIARKSGLDHAHALDFMRGRVFLDGTPVEIERRHREMIGADKEKLAA